MPLRNFAEATHRCHASDLLLFINYVPDMVGTSTRKKCTGRTCMITSQS